MTAQHLQAYTHQWSQHYSEGFDGGCEGSVLPERIPTAVHH